MIDPVYSDLNRYMANQESGERAYEEAHERAEEAKSGWAEEIEKILTSSGKDIQVSSKYKGTKVTVYSIIDGELDVAAETILDDSPVHTEDVCDNILKQLNIYEDEAYMDSEEGYKLFKEIDDCIEGFLEEVDYEEEDY
jgi:hypothetical protein